MKKDNFKKAFEDSLCYYDFVNNFKRSTIQKQFNKAILSQYLDLWKQFDEESFIDILQKNENKIIDRQTVDEVIVQRVKILKQVDQILFDMFYRQIIKLYRDVVDYSIDNKMAIHYQRSPIRYIKKGNECKPHMLDSIKVDNLDVLIADNIKQIFFYRVSAIKKHQDKYYEKLTIENIPDDIYEMFDFYYR